MLLNYNNVTRSGKIPILIRSTGLGSYIEEKRVWAEKKEKMGSRGLSIQPDRADVPHLGFYIAVQLCGVCTLPTYINNN